jgi:Tfp pilus assembly protein PilX
VSTAVAHRAAGRSSQRGVVLFVALIVLIVMALVGVAMMRGSGSGVSIAGNLAFKQNATNVGDIGTEAARTWLMAQTAGGLSADQGAIGYWSSWCGSAGVAGTPCAPTAGGTDVDPMQLNWANSQLATADDGTGNAVRYIVHRLCETSGMASNSPAQHCADAMTAGQGTSKGGLAYPGPGASVVANPFYRISSQVTGPKNTVSYIQVVIQ